MPGVTVPHLLARWWPVELQLVVDLRVDTGLYVSGSDVERQRERKRSHRPGRGSRHRAVRAPWLTLSAAPAKGS